MTESYDRSRTRHRSQTAPGRSASKQTARSASPTRAAHTSHRRKGSEELDNLARRLLARHLQICLPSDTIGYFTNRLKLLGSELNERTRVIAVVGAGASAPALKTAGEAIQALKHESLKHDSGFEEELQRLNRVFNLSPDDFETTLYALSRTEDKKRLMRRELRKFYSRSYPTQIAYELLAHLLKHRFLDAIVSFNFDLLIDTSVRDELLGTEYKLVVSERDCDGTVFNPDEPGYRPLLLKPHGTASDPETLRFTRDSYYSLPTRISHAIKEIIGTNLCIIMSVGFGMTSFDFTQLLGHPAELEIFNFNTDQLSRNAKQEIDRSRLKRKPTTYWDVIVPKPANTGRLSGADRRLRELFSKIQRLCVKTGGIASFRTEARHELLAAALDWDVTSGDQSARLHYQYLRDRAILEMAFSALRARGLVSIGSLIEDRCEIYFEQLKKAASRQHGPDLAWIDLARDGGLVPSEDNNETFVSDVRLRADPSSTIKDFDQATLDLDPGKLLDHLFTTLSINSRNGLLRLGRAKVVQLLHQLAQGSEVEVQAHGDKICSRIFQAPRTLPTSTSLHAKTLHMLATQQYTDVAIVAESGGFLLQPAFQNILTPRTRKDGVRILLITASTIDKRDLREVYKHQIQFAAMPWWQHNRHLTLLYSANHPVAGTYFARHLRALFVTPIYLEASADREWLALRFMEYVDRILRRRAERKRTKPHGAERERGSSPPMSFDAAWTLLGQRSARSRRAPAR